MSYFEIKRIRKGEIAWSWDYKDGLQLAVKEEPYAKSMLVDILKGLKAKPSYEEKKVEKQVVFYVSKDKKEQLAIWKMQKDPLAKLLSELKEAEIKYKNKEDDPNFNPDGNSHNNTGTGETGS